LVANKWWWALRCTKMSVSIFDGGLPKCKDFFLHKFSKRIPAGMKSVNYDRKGNEAQWDEVKPCSVGVAITWLAKFHPDVVKARETEIKYCWRDLGSFSSLNSKGHTRKEIIRFLLDSVVIDHESELFYLITRKRNPGIKKWTCQKFRNDSGRVLAIKKSSRHKVDDGDEEEGPKYVTKMVSLWKYNERLISDLTVDRVIFKPVLIPEP